MSPCSSSNRNNNSSGLRRSKRKVVKATAAGGEESSSTAAASIMMTNKKQKKKKRQPYKKKLCTSCTISTRSSTKKMMTNTKIQPSAWEEAPQTLLPTDIFSKVLDFLSPNEMLRFVSTSKVIMNTCLTHQVIIRNTLLACNQDYMKSTTHFSRIKTPTAEAKEDMLQQLISSMKASSSATTTSMQLHHHHPIAPIRMLRLVTGTHCESCLKVKCNRLVLDSLFLCCKCTNQHVVTTERGRSLVKEFRHQNSNLENSWDMLRKPFRTRGDGTLQGPIVTLQHVQFMDRNGMSFQDFIQDYHPFACVPSPFHSQTLLVERLKTVLQVTMAQVDTISFTSYVRKRKRMSLAILQIQEGLQGPANEFCMMHEYSPIAGVLNMKYLFVEQIMGYMVTMNPRYLSQRRIVQVTRQLDQAVTHMAATGLFDFTCFADDPLTNPLESAMRSYLESTYTPGYDFASQLNREDVLLHNAMEGDAQSILLRIARRSHGLVAQDVIMCALIIEHDDILVDEMEFFAENLFHLYRPNSNYHSDWEDLVEHYQFVSTAFVQYAPLYQEYMVYYMKQYQDFVFQTRHEQLVRRYHRPSIFALQQVFPTRRDFFKVCDFLTRRNWRGLWDFQQESSFESLLLNDELDPYSQERTHWLEVDDLVDRYMVFGPPGGDDGYVRSLFNLGWRLGPFHL